MPTVARITAAGDFEIAGTLTEGDRQPTFSRASVAYKQDGTQVAAAVPRFEAGKFGLALMVEEGTTNKIETEGGASQDWSKWSHWGSGYWQSVTQYDDPVMGKVFQGVCNNPTYLFDYYPYSITSDVVYTFTIWLKASSVVSNLSARAYFIIYQNNQYVIVGSTTKTITLTTEWQKFEWQITATATTSTAGFGIGSLAIPAGTTVYAARPQLEQKPYSTSFINGTRSPEVLTIPTAGVLNPQKGTIECWVYVNDLIKDTSANRYIFAHAVSSSSNRLSLAHSTANNWVVASVNGAGQTSSIAVPDTLSIGYHYFCVRYSPTELALFIDDAKVGGTINPYVPEALADNVFIGCWTSGSYGWVNTLIDDLRISSRARTDNEIAAAYASGQPLPVDEWTTYKLNFDNSLTAIAPIRLTSTGDFKTAGELIEAASNFVIDQGGNLKIIGELIEGVSF